MNVLMTADMANFGGKVHRGKIFSLLDNVARDCASRCSQRYVATGSIETEDERHRRAAAILRLGQHKAHAARGRRKQETDG
jgi:acyl-CoA hydrolase